MTERILIAAVVFAVICLIILAAGAVILRNRK